MAPPKVTLVDVLVALPPSLLFELDSSLGLAISAAGEDGGDQGSCWLGWLATRKRPFSKASQLAGKKKKLAGRKKTVPTTTAATGSGGESRAVTRSPTVLETEPKLEGTTAADVARLKEALKEKMRDSSSGDAPVPLQELRPKMRLFPKSTQ